MSFTKPIARGNSKLGKLVHHWSIPANELICVFASALCASLCYARRGFFLMPNVKKGLEENESLSRRKSFVSRIVAGLRYEFVRVLRVHASGEFYDVEYVRKWIKIVRRSPKVTFYAYTRCWRDEEMLPFLVTLANEPNFHMWWSCDSETGRPPSLPGIRTAYLMTSDDDQPAFDVDLCFRDSKPGRRTNRVMKWSYNGALVCPAENEVSHVTCSQCQLCFKDCKVPKRKQLVSLTVS